MKIKENVSLDKLLEYGFIEDPVNCEHPDDTYYHLNNYYIQIHKTFRITVNVFSKQIEVLCLSDGEGCRKYSKFRCSL